MTSTWTLEFVVDNNGVITQTNHRERICVGKDEGDNSLPGVFMWFTLVEIYSSLGKWGRIFGGKHNL